MGQYSHYTIVTMANEMKKNVVGTFIFTIKSLTSKAHIVNKKPIYWVLHSTLSSLVCLIRAMLLY